MSLRLGLPSVALLQGLLLGCCEGTVTYSCNMPGAPGLELIDHSQYAAIHSSQSQKSLLGGEGVST